MNRHTLIQTHAQRGSHALVIMEHTHIRISILCTVIAALGPGDQEVGRA